MALTADQKQLLNKLRTVARELGERGRSLTADEFTGSRFSRRSIEASYYNDSIRYSVHHNIIKAIKLNLMFLGETWYSPDSPFPRIVELRLFRDIRKNTRRDHS